MFSCQQIQEIMSAYIDGQLTAFESKEFEGHIKLCASCKKEYEILYNIVKSCNSMENVQLPKQYKQQLYQKLVAAAKIKEKHNKQPWYLNWKTYSALAAGILLVFAMKSQIFVYDEYKRAYVDDASLNYIEGKDINKGERTENQVETYKYDEKEGTYIDDYNDKEEVVKEQTTKEEIESDIEQHNRTQTEQEHHGQQDIKDNIINQDNNTSEIIVYKEGDLKIIDEKPKMQDSANVTDSDVKNLHGQDIETQKENIETAKIEPFNIIEFDSKIQEEKQNDALGYIMEEESPSLGGSARNSIMMAMPKQLIFNRAIIEVSQEKAELLWEYVGENLSRYGTECIILDNNTVIMLNEENYIDLIEDFKKLFPDLTIQYIQVDNTQQYNEIIEKQNKLEKEIESLEVDMEITKEEKEYQIQLLVEQKDKLQNEILEIEEISGKYIIEIKSLK